MESDSLDFWDNVSKCSHSNMSQNYSEHVYCGNEDLGCPGGSESHCLDCGVYIAEDPCFAADGFSGWPYKRWGLKRKWRYKAK